MSIEVASGRAKGLAGFPRFVPARGYTPAWDCEDALLPLRSVAEIEEKGEVVAHFEAGGETIPAVVKSGGRCIFAFDPRAAIDDMLFERWAGKPRKPITNLLPFHYHKVPGALRVLAAKMMTPSSLPVERIPGLRALELLRHFIGAVGEKTGVRAWPGGKRWVFCSTHDVDTRKGFALIEKFREIEVRFTIPAQWNIVADHYPIDWGLVKSLEDEGHEIASHGLYHDNRIAFLKPPKIRERLRRIREIFEGRAHLHGFRSPSLLRTEALLEALPEFFEYDSSMADYQIEDGRGCRSLFPFKRGAIAELPITLDMDSSLLFAGCSPEQIFARWLAKLEWIKAVGGMAIFVTHTEPHFSGNDPMLAIYTRMLDVVRRDPSVWITTPSAVAQPFPPSPSTPQ